MNRPAWRSLLPFLLLLALGVLAGGCDGVGERGPRGSGRLEQDVYVWQRDWGPAVVGAVTGHAGNFRRTVILGAEIGWRPDRPPKVVQVAYAPDALSRLPDRVGIALRVGGYSGPFRADDPAGRLLLSTAAGLVDRARREGWEPSELQVDFDCAESRLDGYRVWLEGLRPAVAPVPLTFTALPSWLKRGTFGSLARAADGFVLQVHSLARPRTVSEPFTLCDPGAALRAVERAGGFGVPFRVALPTYGYLVAFDGDGAFLGASAEGPPPERPAGTRHRELTADPVAMAQLVADWTRSRPATMAGLIWYRMPVPGDRWNWRWATLESVMAAKAPRAELRVETRTAGAGLVDVVLRNAGAADHLGPVVVEVAWAGTGGGTGAGVLGADGVRGFAVERTPAEAMLFTQPICRLPAGESAIIGWVRLEAEVPLRIAIRTSPAGTP
jgi:hypothetical protein